MTSKLLGNLEQKVMNVLWESENPLTPRQVLNELEGDYAYTTVMTILSTLTSKGILSRSKEGRAYRYSCIKSKEEFASSRLTPHFGRIYSDFGDLAISRFVDSIKNEPDAMKKLSAYLDRVEDNEKED